MTCQFQFLIVAKTYSFNDLASPSILQTKQGKFNVRYYKILRLIKIKRCGILSNETSGGRSNT